MQIARTGVDHDVMVAVRAIAARCGSPDRTVEASPNAAALCAELFESSARPHAKWRFSKLSSDASPLLFDFSSRDERLRCTCEAAGPDVDAHARLDAALALIARLGGAAPPEDLVQRWRSAQSEHELRWGAWVG